MWWTLLFVPIGDDKVAVNNNLTWYVKKDYLEAKPNQDFWDKVEASSERPVNGSSPYYTIAKLPTRRSVAGRPVAR